MTYNRKTKAHSSGFTLVELMIASTVFAVILMVSMYGFATMSRFYQRGIYAARTQQTARDVVSEIASTIQGTGGDIETSEQNGNTGLLIDNVPFRVICVDTVRYLYQTEAYDASGNPLTDKTGNVWEKTGTYTKGHESDNVLISDTLTNKYGCFTDQIDESTARVLVDKGFRLLNFNITQPDAPNPIYNITLNLVYDPGDNAGANSDYYYQAATGNNNAYAACKGGSGRQYCYTANISTTVVRRIAI